LRCELISQMTKMRQVAYLPMISIIFSIMNEQKFIRFIEKHQKKSMLPPPLNRQHKAPPLEVGEPYEFSNLGTKA